MAACQQMAPADRGNPAAEAAFVLRKKRGWLAGPAKGMTLAGLPAVDEADVYFPYYGNLFVDAIAAREKAGLAEPELELAPVTRPESADSLIFDSARLLGFSPEREPVSEDAADVAEMVRAWQSYIEGDEIDFGSILRNRLLRAALRYLARKTGASELVIEQFLSDVAYYLDVEDIRRLVLDEVAGSPARSTSHCSSPPGAPSVCPR
jgi:endonuclease G